MSKSNLLRFTLLTCLIKAFSLCAQQWPDLPEPVTNNAVAKVTTDKARYLLSFMGLAKNKDYLSVHNKVWSLRFGDSQWQQQASVPSTIEPNGRLASIAVGIGRYAYLFGGYTVDSNHQEISSPDVYRFDVEQNTYKKLSSMPIPVDDSIAVVYQQRYIYLISGWHNDGNINLVQVYDIENDLWFQSSPFLGQPVFGHAGAIVNNTIVVCDGVVVQANVNKRRNYAGTAQCLTGKIDSKNPSRIDWRRITHPTGVGRYRMAATNVGDDVIFVGGSTNPYNYNGIGYNGVPAPASSKSWVYNVRNNQWRTAELVTASMDHRGLIEIDGQLLIIGGMDNNQQVSKQVISHQLDLTGNAK